MSDIYTDAKRTVDCLYLIQNRMFKDMKNKKLQDEKLKTIESIKILQLAIREIEYYFKCL